MMKLASRVYIFMVRKTFIGPRTIGTENEAKRDHQRKLAPRSKKILNFKFYNQLFSNKCFIVKLMLENPKYTPRDRSFYF